MNFSCALPGHVLQIGTPLKRRISQVIALLLCCITYLFCAHTVSANNAGGFVSTVTTAVTSGTEAFGSSTDRFLDNGIIHAVFTSNGSIASMKFLKPGLTGTPKANGIETVSQSGVNFSNHTSVYYYWYPDGNGDAVYLNTVSSGTNIDLVYKRTYNSAADQVPIDMEIHYDLGKGNTILYTYFVANHPSSYSVYADASISFIQVLWPTAHDTANFYFENQYLDNSTKYGLYLNGVQQPRNGLQPSFYDNYNWIGVAGMPKEIGMYTTGTFAGQINGKYSFTADLPKLDVWGMASDVNKAGIWIVQGSHEYQNNGPTACEYAGGIGGITGIEPLIAHYENTGLTVSATSSWTKVYGPWGFYFNALTSGSACWQDAQNQAAAEKLAWPYTWLSNASYQPQTQRATVTGTLVINDSMRPGVSAAGAWVGLVLPDDGSENPPNNWQFQSDEYQYWTQAAADGTFTIPHVTTVSRYGGAVAYELHAYSSGTSVTTGAVGEYNGGAVTVVSGSTTNLGTRTWTVPHKGGGLVWEIGIPDRSAAEFKHGNEYGRAAMWTNFINEFTNPLEYNVSDNNWSTALNYCHSVDNMATSPWKWHINFNVTSITNGTYWLNIAYATADSVQVIRVNDDSSVFATFTPDNATPGSTTYIRQGIHSKYTVAHLAIPSSKLIVGANTITLDHEYHSTHANANFMYDYINLESPIIPVLPPGRDLIWTGGVSSNAWNVNVSATNWVVSGSTGTAVSYVDGDRPLFDDTGSTSPSVTLSGSMTPGQMTFVNGTKNYTLSGPGTINGPMQLIKTGAGKLTISPSVVSLSGTTTSGTGSITVASTSALSVGMSAAGTGIPTTAIVASIDSSTSLTLTQNATASGTNTLTFSALNTYYGGSTLGGGTTTFTNDAANSNGLGTGPIIFNGGTLQMYDNFATYDNANWDMQVPIGSTGTLRTDSRCDLYGTLQGGGIFNFYMSNVRTTLHGDWSHFTGQINVTTDSDGGDFRPATTSGFLGSALHLATKVTMYSNINGSTTISIGELSGDAGCTLQGIQNNGVTPGAYMTTWSLGARNTDSTFAGQITNGASPSTTAITKVGDGTMTLSGACTYTGPTNVLAGTLRFTGTGSTSNSLTVSSDGTLEIAGGSLSISGAATNDGTIRLTGSGALVTSGTLINNGVLDMITSTQSLPANFVNNGVVLNASAAAIQQVAKSGSSVTVAVQSYAGHNYQLQYTSALTSGTWGNLGTVQAGTGDVLTFTDSSSTGGVGFYHITVTP